MQHGGKLCVALWGREVRKLISRKTLDTEHSFDTIRTPDHALDSGSKCQMTQGPAIHEIRARRPRRGFPVRPTMLS